MLQTVVIPDISFDQGYINNNVWSLSRITADQVNITINEEDNAVGVIINDVMAQFHSSNFHVKEGIISASGELDAAMYRVQFIAGTYMTTQPARDGLRLLNNFQPYKVKVNIDRDHMDVTVTGTIYAGLAELIAKLMKGPISDEIEIVVKMELDKNIHKILNKRIDARDGYRMPLKSVAVMNQIKIDMSIPHEWKAKETGLEYAVSAYSFNQNEVEPSLAELGDQQLPPLIPWDPTNKDII